MFRQPLKNQNPVARKDPGGTAGRQALGLPASFDGPITFLSVQGKAGVPRQGEPLINMHGAAADTKGQVWGGHLFRDENPPFPAMDGEFSGKYAL